MPGKKKDCGCPYGAGHSQEHKKSAKRAWATRKKLYGSTGNKKGKK